MDLKGINWVGHMYQKYETMLLEVEDDMYQDVVNYVESQVQTVGDSVKKFYSDVIQDLLPTATEDLLTTGDPDLPVETYADTCAFRKPKAGTMEVNGNVDERAMQNPKAVDVEVQNHASFYHGLSSVNSSFASSSAHSLNGSSSEMYSTLYEDGIMHNYSNHSAKVNTEEKNLRPLVMAGAVTSVTEGSGRGSGLFQHPHVGHDASCDEMATSVSGHNGIEEAIKYESDVSVDGLSSDKSMLSRSIDNEVTEVRLSSCGSLPAETNDMSSSHEVATKASSVTNGDAQCCDVTDQKVISSNSGEEDDSDKDEINNIEPDMETIEHNDCLKLEESCVVVNGDELHCVPPRKGKSRAYKKKIRDALSLRTKSARKEEYKRLAILYAGDAGPNYQCMKSLEPDLTADNRRLSPTHDICESEWEFL